MFPKKGMSDPVLGGRGSSIPKDQKTIPLAIPPLPSPGPFFGGYGIARPREETLIEGSDSCYNDPTALPPDTAQTSSTILGFSEPSPEVTFYTRIHHDSSPVLECVPKENDIPLWSPNPSPSCFDSDPFIWAQSNGRSNPGPIDELVNNQVRIKFSLTRPKINPNSASTETLIPFPHVK